MINQYDPIKTMPLETNAERLIPLAAEYQVWVGDQSIETLRQMSWDLYQEVQENLMEMVRYHLLTHPTILGVNLLADYEELDDDELEEGSLDQDLYQRCDRMRYLPTLEAYLDWWEELKAEIEDMDLLYQPYAAGGLRDGLSRLLIRGEMPAILKEDSQDIVAQRLHALWQQILVCETFGMAELTAAFLGLQPDGRLGILLPACLDEASAGMGTTKLDSFVTGFRYGARFALDTFRPGERLRL